MRYWKSLKLKDDTIVSGHDGSEWRIGEWREVQAPTEECVGLNCCKNIVDAMGFVGMEVLAEVEIDGKIIVGNDKITCEKMRIIKAWKWKKEDSVMLSIFAARLCRDNFEKLYPDDKRPREAIEVAGEWLKNPCEETQTAALSAARSAESAALSAAWSAAWSAESAALSAESAALSAARSAAWSAARSAAWSAAMSAESAVRSAAGSAARAGTKKKIHDWIVEHTKEMPRVVGDVP